METSEQINEITAALSALAAEMRDAQKDVSGYGYKYAAIDSYLAIARPLLAKHGLALVQMPSAGGDTVTVSSMLSHKSGQWIRSALTMPVELKKGLSMAQCIGMVITYARRYAMAAMLGMAAEDSDASIVEVPTNVSQSANAQSLALAALVKALDANDPWAVLEVARQQDSYRGAFGTLNSKQKAACRELEQKAATMRADYVDALSQFAQAGDEHGAQQLVEELSQSGKRLVWELLDANTKTFLKALKREAA